MALQKRIVSGLIAIGVMLSGMGIYAYQTTQSPVSVKCDFDDKTAIYTKRYYGSTYPALENAVYDRLPGDMSAKIVDDNATGSNGPTTAIQYVAIDDVSSITIPAPGIRTCVSFAAEDYTDSLITVNPKYTIEYQKNGTMVQYTSGLAGISLISVDNGRLYIIGNDTGITLSPKRFYMVETVIKDNKMYGYLNGTLVMEGKSFGDINADDNPPIWPGGGDYIYTWRLISQYVPDLLVEAREKLPKDAVDPTQYVTVYFDDVYVGELGSGDATSGDFTFRQDAPIYKTGSGKIFLNGLTETDLTKYLATPFNATLVLNGTTAILKLENGAVMMFYDALTDVMMDAEILKESFGTQGAWMADAGGISAEAAFRFENCGGGKKEDDISLKSVIDQANYGGGAVAETLSYRLSGTELENLSEISEEDDIIFNIMIKPEDCNAERKVCLTDTGNNTLIALNAEGKVLAGGRDVVADYTPGEWLNISAILHSGSKIWTLYMNGEECEEEYRLDAPLDLSAGIALITVPNHADVSENGHSETAWDNLHIYTGTFFPNLLNSTMSITGFEGDGRSFIRTNGDMTVLDFLKHVNCSNSFVLYRDKNCDSKLADDDYLTNSVYVVETAMNGENLHTYHLDTKIALTDAQMSAAGDTLHFSGALRNLTLEQKKDFTVIVIQLKNNVLCDVTFETISSADDRFSMDVPKAFDADKAELWMIDCWMDGNSLSDTFHFEIK